MVKRSFFNKDKKLYDIKHNREFLSWYKRCFKNGYTGTLSLDDIQNFIDYLSMWYFIKYPNRGFVTKEGYVDYDFPNPSILQENMSFYEFLYHLPKGWIDLLKSVYRSNYNGTIPLYSNGELVGYEPVIGVSINKNKQIDGDGLSSIILEARSIDGIVNNQELKKNFPQISLSSLDLGLLLDELKKDNSYDLTHLNEIIYNHNVDLELRNRIIFYTSLKILYNRSSLPLYNYRRAKEFNKELSDNLGIKLDESYLDDLTRDEMLANNSSKKRR